MSDDPSIRRMEELSERLSEQLVVDPDLLRQMFDGMPDGVVLINESGLIQFVNRRLELIFGYSRTMLRGQPIHMLLASEIREQHAKHIAMYFQRPTERPMNFAKVLEGRHRLGRAIRVRINLAPLSSDQGTLAMAVVREEHGPVDG